MSESNYSIQSRIGRDAALAAVDNARRLDSPLPIVRALQEIVRTGKIDGYETGFLFECAERLQATS